MDKSKEICRIQIMIPVDNDEQAIECKKKIQAALEKVDGVTITFTLASIPPKPYGVGI